MRALSAINVPRLRGNVHGVACFPSAREVLGSGGTL